MGHLQVACGQSKKTYLKNIKMQEISTKTIPTGNWGPNADSISVTQVENGIKFTSGIEAKEWENGVNIEGNFVETSKNYLYKITFTAVADANDVKLNYSADAVSDENVWGSATIGKTATNIELYMPAYQLDGDELRGAELDFSLSTKNSVTITNVKFEPLTAIPSNQVIFFTSDYKVYKKITSTGKDNCVVLDVAANTEADLRFVMEKATNSKIEWNNSCSFSKFVNKTSATVSIPDGKDYLVLKNTSNASQSYRLYIDETWTIVIEDATTTPAVEYIVKYVSTDYDYTGTFEGEKILSEGTQLELPQLDGIPDDDYPKRFGGWYEGVVMEPGDITPDMTNATKVTSPYTVTKDVTLYAVWVMDETITFVTGYEADGIIVDPIKTESYAKINLPTPTAPTGMTFEGWYCDGDNDDEIIWEWAEKVSSPYMVNRPRTLFAKWKSVDAPDFFANKAAVTKTDEYGNIIRDDFGNIVIFESAIVDSLYTEQANRYKYQDYIAGTVSGVSVTNSNSENIIKNTNYVSGTSTEWDYWLASTESFKMIANQNYEVSLEVKADLAQDVRFVLKDYKLSANPEVVNVYETVTSEWQTIKFETGSLQANWKAFLEIPVGTIDSLYVRNFKVEPINTNVLPVKGWKDSEISNRTEDGFTVKIDNTDEWISIVGQKAELGNIYLVSFDVVAEDETEFNFGAKASSGKYADAWYKTTVGTTATKIELYVPHVGSDSSYTVDFMDMGFNSSVATTLTISNFEVTPVPMEEKPAVVIALQGDNDRWDQFMGYLGSGTPFTLAAGESVEVFAHIGAENFDNWDVVSELRTLTPSEYCLVSVNSENRPVITNNTDMARQYMLWVYDYQLVVDDVESQTYSVTFNLNGGTVDGSGSNITIETIGLSVVTPVKEGYIFKGWTETKDGDDYITSATSDMTVYAKWVSPLQLFDGGDVAGEFAPNGQALVYDSDKQVYETSFTYSADMNSWGSLLGTVAFKFRPIAGDWTISYGPIGNQPVLDGEEVEFGEVSGVGTDLSVSGLVEGTTYKIEVRCTEEGKFFVKVSTETE